jgi:hypothetical protein
LLKRKAPFRHPFSIIQVRFMAISHPASADGGTTTKGNGFIKLSKRSSRVVSATRRVAPAHHPALQAIL